MIRVIVLPAAFHVRVRYCTVPLDHCTQAVVRAYCISKYKAVNTGVINEVARETFPVSSNLCMLHGDLL